MLNQIPAGLAVAHAGRGKRWVAPDVRRRAVEVHAPGAAHSSSGPTSTPPSSSTGYAATTYPFQLQQIRAGGNAFGDHTVTHTQLTRETPARRRWELLSTAERVQAATGVRPTLFRPPYGESSREINTMARTLGMLPITWSVDSKDWTRPGVKQIVANALKGAVPGGIILMHDGGGNRSETVKALPLILKALKQRHLTSVTLPQLLNAQPPEHGDLVRPRS